MSKSIYNNNEFPLLKIAVKYINIFDLFMYSIVMCDYIDPQ